MERKEAAQPEPVKEAGLLRHKQTPPLPPPPVEPATESGTQPEAKPEPVNQGKSDTVAQPAEGETHAAAAAWRLSLFLSTTETTDVSLYCGGVETLSRELMPGETVSTSCSSEAFLSASNAGALLLKVNGKDCMPLGERGAELVNFPLNRERTKNICSGDRGPS